MENFTRIYIEQEGEREICYVYIVEHEEEEMNVFLVIAWRCCVKKKSNNEAISWLFHLDELF